MGYTPQRLARQVQLLHLVQVLAAQNEYHPGWTSTHDVIRAATAQSDIGADMWRKDMQVIIQSALVEVDTAVPEHVDRRRQWVRLTDTGRQVTDHAPQSGAATALHQQYGQQIIPGQ